MVLKYIKDMGLSYGQIDSKTLKAQVMGYCQIVWGYRYIRLDDYDTAEEKLAVIAYVSGILFKQCQSSACGKFIEFDYMSGLEF